MKAYTAMFIGHRDYDHSADQYLEENLIELIRMGYCRFLSGGMGEFDLACEETVRHLKAAYPHISLCLVMNAPSSRPPEGYDEIILPEHIKPELKSVSIPVRNKLMVQCASAAVCYMKRMHGGAYSTYTAALREALVIYCL